MTTEEAPAADGAAEPSQRDGSDATDGAIDSYRVTLDRERCEGVFACLVRDERFVEAADGLATLDDRPGPSDTDGDDLTATVTASFEDERLDAARQAAAACPVDAIDLEVAEDG